MMIMKIMKMIVFMIVIMIVIMIMSKGAEGGLTKGVRFSVASNDSNDSNASNDSNDSNDRRRVEKHARQLRRGR